MKLPHNRYPLLLTVALACASIAAAQPPEILIGGSLHDGGGKPVANAKVQLLPLLPRFEQLELRRGHQQPAPVVRTLSDASGRFRLPAPAIGMWRVRVEARGYLTMEHRLVPLLHDLELPALKLEPARQLEVQVRSGAGQPLQAELALDTSGGAATRLFGRRGNLGSGWQTARRTASTDDQGTARLPYRADEPLDLLTVVAGYPPLETQVAGRRKLSITPLEGADLPLLILGVDGKPAPGAWVLDRDQRLVLGRSDEDGRFVAHLSRRQAQELHMATPGASAVVQLEAPPPTADGSPAEVAEQRVELAAEGTASGRVIDRQSRRPVPGALVWSPEDPAGAQRTGSGGTFDLLFGRGRGGGLRAAAVGYAAGRSSNLNELDESRPTTLVLHPAATLEGRVVDSEGLPLAGAELEVEAQRGRGRGRRIMITPGTFGLELVGRSDPEGRFRIQGVPAKQAYRLLGQKEGFAPAELEISSLQPFESRTDLRLVLDAGKRAGGRVIDQDEVPIAGAAIRLVPAAAGGGGGPRLRIMALLEGDSEEPPVYSKKDGSFEIRDLAAGRFDLQVEASGFAPTTVPGVEIPAIDQPVDLGTLVLLPGVSIAGRVSGSAGVALDGARIEVREADRMGAMLRIFRAEQQPADAVTAGDGVFVVGDLRGGQQFDVIVERDGYIGRTISGVVAPTAELLNIVLKPASRVLGRVVDTDGNGLREARVSVTAERQGGSAGGFRGVAGRSRTTSDQLGSFIVEQVEPGKITIEGSVSGFQSYRLSGLEVPEGGDLEDVELVLRPGSTVEGTVIGPDGLPVIEAQIEAFDPSAGGGLGFRNFGSFAFSDGDGRFVLSGLPLGPFAVSADHEGYQKVVKDVELESGVNRVDLVFSGGQEVAGRVLDSAGQPVGNTFVMLRSSGNAWNSPQATSEADGSFLVTGVSRGSYRLTADKDGFARTELDDEIQIEEESVYGLEVVLRSGATVTGQVLGVEFDDFSRVEVSGWSSGGYQRGQIDYEGNYEVHDLLPGNATVAAQISGSGRRVQESVEIEEGVQALVLDLDFSKGYVLTGRALHGEAPISGADISLSGIDVSHRGSATTAVDGSFRIENLLAGSYRLRLLSWETGLQHNEEIDIEGDQELTIELETATVSGWLRDSYDSAPVDGAALEVESLDQPGDGGGNILRRSIRSDSQGYFDLGAVNAGRWRLVATREGYATAEANLELTAGQVIDDLEIEMTSTEGVRFEVASPTGGRLEQVNVLIQGADGQHVASGTWEATENGRVRVSTVPAGSWEMLLATPGSATTTLQITAPGQLGRLVLQQGGRLAITVADLNDDDTPATVTVLGADGQPYRRLGWGGRVQQQWPLSNGRITLRDLPPGNVSLQVTANDGRVWNATAQVVAGRESPAEIR